MIFNHFLLTSNLLITIIFAVVLTLLRLLSRPLGVDFLIDSGLFTLGLLVGVQVYVVDVLIYAYITAPEAEASLTLKHLVKTYRWRELIRQINYHRLPELKLATYNILFLVVWVFLGLFVVTSSPSLFAKGLVLGIGLTLSLKLVRDWSGIETLKQRLFWPVTKPLSTSELKIVIYVFWAIFIFLSLLMV